MKVLTKLRNLGIKINIESNNWNPIKLYEAITLTDDYLYFQDGASEPICESIIRGGTKGQLLDHLSMIYLESLRQ